MSRSTHPRTASAKLKAQTGTSYPDVDDETMSVAGQLDADIPGATGQDGRSQDKDGDEVMTTERSSGSDDTLTRDPDDSYKPAKKKKQLKDADSKPAKRRGPKPDIKPAKTRRQELNRQAQRTHRERKEQYIKALEQEVFRLKELYTVVCYERDVRSNENGKLRDLLAANGIPVPEDLSTPRQQVETESVANLSVAANADTAKNDSTPRSAMTSHELAPSLFSPKTSDGQVNPGQAIDYDQIGIEFVLALEQPCMDHTQMLCAQASTDEGTISGHALMATCPPAAHLHEQPDEPYPHQVPDMKPNDLRRLLDLSSKLPLYSEVTPVMAWSKIMQDHRLAQLTVGDLVNIKNELQSKIRCYGFGAVLEEFEVRDALETVLAAPKDPGQSGSLPAQPQPAMSPAPAPVAVSG